MPLSMPQKERILRDVSLGVPPPDDETEEARQWRERMEDQVEEMREQGMENVIPFDAADPPESSEPAPQAQPPAPPPQSSTEAAVPAPAADEGDD